MEKVSNFFKLQEDNLQIIRKINANYKKNKCKL